MKTSQPKTLVDFPKFVVTEVRAGAASSDGYQRFELEGSYDPILDPVFDNLVAGEGPLWFWLLFGKRGYLTPMLKSFDKETKKAILVCDEKEEPKVLGLQLAYLSPYWQAFNIWMVLDADWGWEKRQFHGIDAVAEDYEAKEVSFVEGREIRVWTKMEPVGVDSGQSRHYPASNQGLPVVSGTRLIPGGWGHEHCQLCHEHIDAEDFGYCDPDNRWMCENCHQRYVMPHDLAFVDEL